STQRSLRRGEEDADHEAEEGHALDEGRRGDHRRPDVATGLRLAGRAFERAGGEAADAEAGAEGDEAGTETGSEVTESNRFHGVSGGGCRGGGLEVGERAAHRVLGIGEDAVERQRRGRRTEGAQDVNAIAASVPTVFSG